MSEQARYQRDYFSYCDALRKRGHLVSHALLQGLENSVSLHVVNGEVSVCDALPEKKTQVRREVLQSVLCLEARDLNHAIAIVAEYSQLCAGRVEIRSSFEIKARGDSGE